MFLVCDALTAYWVILLIRIILSWTTMFWSPPSSLTPAIKVVYDLTEPVMAFFRRFIPPIGGLDLSPIFIFIILQLIRSAICPG
ncbi:MAG TPA: YggT family protein [Actinomycetota bacterium]|nr:YggT family protein [Actinomycetota bacterium]